MTCFLLYSITCLFVGKEYDVKDSNIKFLRALPEECDRHSLIIRHPYDLDTVSFDKVYEMLRTYDLEAQQRNNKRSSKAKSIALNFDNKQSKSRTVETSRRKTVKIK